MTTAPTISAGSRSSVAAREWHRAVGAAVLVGYLLCVVTANFATTDWAPLVIGGLVVPAGTLFAGATLTIRDLLHDTYGVRGAAMGIAAGAALSALVASPRIAAASVAAFTLSELLDTLVYARLRHRTRFGAVAVSNTTGLVVDSVLFVPLALGTFTAVPGQIVGKTVATAVTVAVLLAMGAADRVVRP